MGGGVGMGAVKPIQYRQYELLKTFSSTEKLTKLYESHQSEAVRCYSFWALTERVDSTKLLELLESGLSDEREVSTMFGCFRGRSKVADFLIGLSRGLISEYDSLILDSVILFSNNDLRSRHHLLMTIEPEERYYNRIKELSINRTAPTAIIALSKFQKEIDTDVIVSQITDSLVDPYYPLLAIKNFPHDLFKKDLLQIQGKTLKNSSGISYVAVRALYKALVRYDDTSIKERLETLVKFDTDIQTKETLPDSVKLFFLIDQLESDFHEKNLENFYSKYAVHNHLSALRLALFEFPNSKYQYLAKEMTLENHEIEMIKNEFKNTNYE